MTESGTVVSGAVEPTANRLLSHLRQAPDRWCSGTELAALLGVSRTAVWKQIGVLTAEGFRIERRAGKGYRLLSLPTTLNARAVIDGLTTQWLGRPFRLLPEVTSTNATAMADATLGHGAVVSATQQTGGRGRLGRVWETPVGTVPLSLVLEPPMAPDRVPLLTLATAVGLAAGIHRATGVAVQVKWPNDLLVGGRKLAGILTEARSDPDRVRRAVVGIGLNVNTRADGFPEPLRPVATSLMLAVGTSIPVPPLVCHLLAGLETVYDRLWSGPEGVSAILADYRALCITLGQPVVVSGADGDLVGTARAVDDAGALEVETDQGIHRVWSGDVTLSGPVR